MFALLALAGIIFILKQNRLDKELSKAIEKKAVYGFILVLIAFILNQDLVYAQQNVYGPQGQVLGFTPNSLDNREPVYGPNGYIIGTTPKGPKNLNSRSQAYENDASNPNLSNVLLLIDALDKLDNIDSRNIEKTRNELNILKENLKNQEDKLKKDYINLENIRNELNIFQEKLNKTENQLIDDLKKLEIKNSESSILENSLTELKFLLEKKEKDLQSYQLDLDNTKNNLLLKENELSNHKNEMIIKEKELKQKEEFLEKKKTELNKSFFEKLKDFFN